jgi:hypothetical protein
MLHVTRAEWISFFAIAIVITSLPAACPSQRQRRKPRRELGWRQGRSDVRPVLALGDLEVVGRGEDADD